MSESLGKGSPKKDNRRTIFIRCDCQSEILVLDYDSEFEMVDLCIYKIDLSHESKMSFWQKIRYVYHLMKYGRPYADQIVLNRPQIDELKAFLNTI